MAGAMLFYLSMGAVDALLYYNIRFFSNCLLAEQRSSVRQHRCVTPLYRIPVGSFNCVLLPYPEALNLQRHSGAFLNIT